ncbi:MAG: hypothetical protein LUC98_07540 [Lachnospiraceae bacterium]|nr:hypothetical protein [Lachnospiraceae bacterium]
MTEEVLQNMNCTELLVVIHQMEQAEQELQSKIDGLQAALDKCSDEKAAKEENHRKQMLGIASAKARGVKFGRPKKTIPKNFGKLVAAWEKGEISVVTAADRCDMSISTFYRRLREYRARSGYAGNRK